MGRRSGRRHNLRPAPHVRTWGGRCRGTKAGHTQAGNQTGGRPAGTRGSGGTDHGLSRPGHPSRSRRGLHGDVARRRPQPLARRGRGTGRTSCGDDRRGPDRAPRIRRDRRQRAGTGHAGAARWRARPRCPGRGGESVARRGHRGHRGRRARRAAFPGCRPGRTGGGGRSLEHRHRPVVRLAARRGSGQRDAPGRRAGPCRPSGARGRAGGRRPGRWTGGGRPANRQTSDRRAATRHRAIPGGRPTPARAGRRQRRTERDGMGGAGPPVRRRTLRPHPAGTPDLPDRLRRTARPGRLGDDRRRAGRASQRAALGGDGDRVRRARRHRRPRWDRRTGPRVAAVRGGGLAGPDRALRPSARGVVPGARRPRAAVTARPAHPGRVPGPAAHPRDGPAPPPGRAGHRPAPASAGCWTRSATSRSSPA